MDCRKHTNSLTSSIKILTSALKKKTDQLKIPVTNNGFNFDVL